MIGGSVVTDHRSSPKQRLRAYRLDKIAPPAAEAEGRLTRSVGLTLEAVGLNVSLGRQCQVINKEGGIIEAEVVGFAGDYVYLWHVKRVWGLREGGRGVSEGGRLDCWYRRIMLARG